MSKLSRKRKRLPGPLTSTQIENVPGITNGARPSPEDRNENFFRSQLESAINDSKKNPEVIENPDFEKTNRDSEGTNLSLGSGNPNTSNTLVISKMQQNDIIEETFKQNTKKDTVESKRKEQKDDTGFGKGKKKPTKEKHSKRTVYCICRKEERPGMIGCDHCDEWYHTQCLSLTKDEVKKLSNENWYCPNCELKRDTPQKSQNSALGTKYSTIANSKQIRSDESQNLHKSASSPKHITKTSTKQIQIDESQKSARPASSPKYSTTVSTKQMSLNEPQTLHKQASSPKYSTTACTKQLSLDEANKNDNFATSAKRSASVPRKWKPPAMITSDTNCMKSKNDHTSPFSLTKDTIAQLTPRLRVGLTRTYKSPKPLHASLKWTP